MGNRKLYPGHALGAQRISQLCQGYDAAICARGRVLYHAILCALRQLQYACLGVVLVIRPERQGIRRAAPGLRQVEQESHVHVWGKTPLASTPFAVIGY